MPRRRSRRRRSARSFAAPAALCIALAVVAAAIALIVRGDDTPRPPAAAAHHRMRPLATPLAAVATPLAPAVSPSAAAASSPPAATPTAAATAAPHGEPGVARLAVIIDDCGQWAQTERGFIALPQPLTLSVLPRVRYGEAIARDASAAGKGVMLHLPMEPRSGADAGPGEVTTAMDDATIARVVAADLADVPLAEGVNNHEGSRATADDRVMRDVAAAIAPRRLFFIDSRTSAATVARRDASAAGLRTAQRDVFLDDVDALDAVESELRRAAEVAKARGSAIAIGHPRPSTLLALRTLMPQLERDGITFVLARDLVR